MRTEVRFSAFGGQGMILAGVILGEAAITDGNNAVQSQSYGPESRGGSAKSEIIIADEDIDYPMVIKADCFVTLSQPGFEKYADNIKPGATVITDSDLVTGEKPADAGAFYSLPLAVTADKIGNRIFANIVMLGSVCAITNVVTKDNLIQSVKKYVPERFFEQNLEAFNEGFALGQEALKK
jgi:2-oxoglutarate ferredoxin oxidoreductase subunit gamma